MPTGVYKRTKKQLERMSITAKKKGSGKWMKGWKHSEEFKRKVSKARKGSKHSEKTKQKIRIAHKGKKVSNETKEKIRIANTGKKYSEVMKEKCRQRMLGSKLSKETRQKMSEATEKAWKRIGVERCHWWKGGISDDPYSEDWTKTLRRSIRERDKYICQICGIHQDELNRALDVHHIDYDKENCDPKNLISLCRKCHLKTNSKREHWIKYFK